MASARLSSLLEQRRLLRTNLGDRRRVLSARDISVDSIARKQITKEIEAMVKQYNAGELSNEQMREFLTNALVTPGLVDADRKKIEDQIRDFDERIVLTQLETQYKATPQNSAERILAAQRIASYYEDRANRMPPDTVAQLRAFENAFSWNERARQDKMQMESRARKLFRAREEQKINMLPSSSSQRAGKKAMMYQDLALKAQEDGDELEAARFFSLANQEQTREMELAQKEGERKESEDKKRIRSEIVNAMNQLADDYHDGRITEDQYLSALSYIEQAINEYGETALALSLNRTVDTLVKNKEKGGLRRAVVGGLPAVLGSNRGLSKKGPVETTWDKEDFDYNDDIRLANNQLQQGTLTPQMYQQFLTELVARRYEQLQKREEALYQQSQRNPNERVYYEGKKRRVVDVLDSINKELEEVGSQVEAAKKGNIGLVVVPPDQFNTTGTIKASGKPYATYKIFDVQALPKNLRSQFARDEYGVYHPITREQIPVDPSDVDPISSFLVNYEKYKVSPGSKVYFDKSGNPYVFGKQVVSVFKPGSSESIEQVYEPGKSVRSYDQLSRGLSPTTKDGRLEVGIPVAKEAQTTTLPPKQQFEGAIVSPAPVRLDPMNLPPGLTVLAPSSQNVSQATEQTAPKEPEVKKPQPLTLPNIQIPRVSVPKIQYNPAETFKQNVEQVKNVATQAPQKIATTLQPVAQKAAEVIKQSPFQFLKNKLFGR